MKGELLAGEPNSGPSPENSWHHHLHHRHLHLHLCHQSQNQWHLNIDHLIGSRPTLLVMSKVICWRLHHVVACLQSLLHLWVFLSIWVFLLQLYHFSILEYWRIEVFLQYFSSVPINMIVTITINTFALFTSTAQHLPHCHCIVSNMFRITNSLLSHHDRYHRHHLHNHNNCHHHHLCLGQSLIRFISEAQDLPHCHTEAPNVWLMAELLRRSHFHKEYFPHDENKQQNVWGVSNCKCYRVGAIHCPRPSRRNGVPQDNDGEGKTFSNLKGFINVINLVKSGEKSVWSIEYNEKTFFSIASGALHSTAIALSSESGSKSSWN